MTLQLCYKDKHPCIHSGAHVAPTGVTIGDMATTRGSTPRSAQPLWLGTPARYASEIDDTGLHAMFENAFGFVVCASICKTTREGLNDGI